MQYVHTQFQKKGGYLVSWRMAVTSAVALLLFGGLSAIAHGAIVVRQEIEPGVFASVRNGEMLILECRMPTGDSAIKGLLDQYLADTNEWTLYRSASSVAIRFERLNPRAQRKFLEALFPDDYVDEAGWWHAIAFEGEYAENFEAMAQWFTGQAANAGAIRQAPQNRNVAPRPNRGQRILIPAQLLNEVMRVPTPRPPPLVAKEEPLLPTPAYGELTYAQDREGNYAVYRLKRGEALYSSVVVRFTDIRENADIHDAIRIVAARSGLGDPNRVREGQRIFIPTEMLADRYQPEGSERRQNYEAVRQEARALQQTRVRSKDLDGVVIVLDPGHGGRDKGASHPESGLYEDALNYDIVSRIKRILETTTQARVYVTLLDPDQGYEPQDRSRFSPDTQKILLTTPNYPNHDARISANLRWYLVNRIYREELKKGTDKNKMLFASIHCDALFNEKLRGAMVYVPGAEYRRDREHPNGMIYATYAEVREQGAVTTTAAMRRQDEAMSRNFAEVLLENLRHHNPPIYVHSTGDPIRNVIRQSGGVAYVPAVIRNTLIPTKVLVECANLTNPTDRKNLADPHWRQAFAEAFVEAVKDHFGD